MQRLPIGIAELRDGQVPKVRPRISVSFKEAHSQVDDPWWIIMRL